MDQNEVLFDRAQKSIPGGVNSPVRAFRSVGGAPRFIKKALGPHMYDVEGKQYIDYIGSWGPMILGHNNPHVIEAVKEAVDNGLSFGAPTVGEIDILVSSGTEAGMSAIRLARGYTGRNKIVKFEGCYHGHSDSLLVKGGSGLLTFGTPSSAGVPTAVTNDTIVLEYNNPKQLKELFDKEGDEIACVIVEAVAGNMNMVPATQEFLETMREETAKHGTVLIVDEVMTGFRVALGGAQSLYHIDPDITMFGKVIGGGMPVAAFGGKRDIMNSVAPLGPVYQAGTLSGNPVAVTCGLATLHEIQQPGFYKRLSEQTAKLVFSAQSIGGMFGIYFRGKCPTSFKEVMECDADRFKTFFHAMLDNGVYLAPSIYEAGFVSITHDDSVIARTLEAADEAFAKVTRVHG